MNEKLVSRRHARITYTEKYPEVVDLRSANGTYLNGKKTKRAYLKDGDNLQVGTSAFKVTLGSREAASLLNNLTEIEQRHIREALGKAGTSPHESVLSGQLKEMNLSSLIQALATNNSTGDLLIRSSNLEGTIRLDGGKLVHASLGEIEGTKARYRLIPLEDGTFMYFSPGRKSARESAKDGLAKHLMEAARHIDELPIYRAQLPRDDGHLVFDPKVGVALAKIPSSVFEVLAAIRKHETVGKVIECCPLPDLEICGILLELLQKEVIRAIPPNVETTRT